MANKYLDNTGLTRMWSRIKSYLSSNYATKSALSSGLSGKANSSHTHTIAQVTNLQGELTQRLKYSYKDYGTKTGIVNADTIGIGEISFYRIHYPRGTDALIFNAPSSGRYFSSKGGFISGGGRIEYIKSYTSDSGANEERDLIGYYIRIS